jgi:hypothetical protein
MPFRPHTLALVVLLSACGAGHAHQGVTVAIDSTTDTLRVTVSGDVPADQVRRLEVELAIAPGVDDTTLFTMVRQFTVDGRGRFWVFDDASRSLFLFDPDGRLLRRIGRNGAGPGEFRANAGMVALTDGGLALWDPRNSRITTFDADGAFRATLPVPGGFNPSRGLHLDTAGALYIEQPLSAPRLGEIFGRIGLVRVGPDGTLLDSLLPPDLNLPRAQYVARNGKNTMATGARYAGAYHWAWLRGRAFVTGDGARNLLLVTGVGRPPMRIVRHFSPVAVAPEERGEEEALIRYELRRTDPGWQWDGPPLPMTKAPLVEVTTDRTGRIWAQVAVPSVRLTRDQLRTPRDAADPVGHFEMPVAYEVFTATGQFLGRVAFPREARLMEADGDTVWAIAPDESGIPAVIRYRITPGLAR